MKSGAGSRALRNLPLQASPTRPSASLHRRAFPICEDDGGARLIRGAKLFREPLLQGAHVPTAAAPHSRAQLASLLGGARLATRRAR